VLCLFVLKCLHDEKVDITSHWIALDEDYEEIVDAHSCSHYSWQSRLPSGPIFRGISSW
jgi:hypothetical protein